MRLLFFTEAAAGPASRTSFRVPEHRAPDVSRITDLRSCARDEILMFLLSFSQVRLYRRPELMYLLAGPSRPRPVNSSRVQSSLPEVNWHLYAGGEMADPPRPV